MSFPFECKFKPISRDSLLPIASLDGAFGVVEDVAREVYPPRSNRGVRIPKGCESAQKGSESTDILGAAFFDWYQASLSVDADEFVGHLCDFYSAYTVPAKPQPPYLYALEVVSSVDGLPVCTVHAGGINEKLMFRASSDRSIEAAEFLREHYPEHSVSRVDVALDFEEGPDFFLDVCGWFLDYASGKTELSSRQLKTSMVGDWANGKDGRTLYIGSRQSSVFIRIYEKGIEQLQKNNDAAKPDWVRIEAEIKPQKAGKELLSRASAQECFGSSKILRDFAKIFGHIAEPLRVGSVYQKTNFDRSFSHMCYQYAETLEQLFEKAGGNHEAFAIAILDKMTSERKKRKNCRDSLAVRSRDFNPGEPFWKN